MMRAPLRSGRGGIAATLVAAVVLIGACSSGDARSQPATPSSAPPRGASTTSTAAAAKTTQAVARYRYYRTVNYADPSHWLCRPDTAGDACHRDLDTTVVAADGTTTIERFEAAANPAIDCFYVYPTISKDPTPFSDWEASADQEGLAAYHQVARLRSDCRVFAPVYRQRTLAGLISAFGGTNTDVQGDPYADVLDAWRTYMSRDNHGRGVVLVGHSQGSGMLLRLLREEIDPAADVRALLVGAYLPGATLRVPEGASLGGDLSHIGVCRRDGEVGCVTTWATFRSTAPPAAGALFGTIRGDDEGEAACANPARLAGGDAPLHGYFSSNRSGSILTDPGGAPGAAGWLPGTTITTPFVSLPGLVSGECVRRDGFHFLSVTVHPGAGPRADDIAGDLTPQWGLHLVDMDIVMGDVVRRVAEQAEAYTR